MVVLYAFDEIVEKPSKITYNIPMIEGPVVENNTKKDILSRRNVLGFMGLSFMAGVEAYVIHHQNYIEAGVKRNGGVNKPDNLPSETIEDGRIISEKELVRRYRELIDNNIPVYPDPTIIRSTVFHAMESFGMGKNIPYRRSGLVTISDRDNGRCRLSPACVYSIKGDLNMELVRQSLDQYSDDYGRRLGWLVLLNLLAHESYHMSVDFVDDRKSTEDYGVLGKIFVNGGRKGFTGAKDTWDGLAGTMINDLIADLPGRSIYHGIAEEFCSELGRLRYLNHMVRLGLITEASWKILSLSEYSELQPGLTNGEINNINPWHKRWGDVLSFQSIDRYHRLGDRIGFYEQIGQHIVQTNPNSSQADLSVQDIRGLGALAFKCFALTGIPGENRTLDILFSERLTKELIYSLAEKTVYSPNQKLT